MVDKRHDPGKGFSVVYLSRLPDREMRPIVASGGSPSV